jgi:hypothetical protein
LQILHVRIVSDLPDELTMAGQFPNGHRLVGSLAPIGLHVFSGLDGLPRNWDVMDVHETVTVSTSTYANLLFVLLHQSISC